MQTSWKNSYFVFLMVLLASSVRADEPIDWCMTDKTGTPPGTAGGCPTEGTCDLPAVRNSWIPNGTTPVVTLRVKFHVFCNTDGSNCAASPSDIADAMEKLNADFAPHRIQFRQVSPAEFVHDSTYRVVTNAAGLEAMKNNFAENPTEQLNIYVTDVPGLSALGTFPWDSHALGELGGIYLDEILFGVDQTTLTHEMGHCVGL